MPGKKKKGGKKGGERPPLGGPTDSLRADIAAARDGQPHNPFVDGEGRDDDGDDDIAAQLLASLDARDEAEAQAKAPPAANPVPVPNAHGDQLSPQTSKDSNGHRHRSSSGVLSGLKEAGEKLLHPSRSPSSSISAGGGSSPNGAVTATTNGEAGSPSKSASGTIRSIFGGGSSHRSSDPAIPETAVAEGDDEPQRKMGRQKLRKQRKAAEAAAERARYEEELKANGGNVDEAALEKQGIDLACESLGVTMHEISPDGHCLYAAIADQYATHYRHKSNYQAMRKTTAQFMQSHRDDFLPFISDGDEKMAGISNPEAGKSGHGNEAAKEDHFLAYCHAIENTGVWGGQPEMLALSRALQVPIWVIQSGSPPVKIGQEEQGVVKGQQRQPLMLSYHRKMYGLGEHYNSLRPK